MKEVDLRKFEVARRNALVVDVRPHESFRFGHIPKAINLPVDEIAEMAASTINDQSNPIIVYCGGPGCPLASNAAKQLRELGYADVDLFQGGLEEWIGAGKRLVRDLPEPISTDAPTNRVLRIVDSVSIGQWVLAWAGMVLSCAMFYWGVAEFGVVVLTHRGEPLSPGLASFLDCVYFSVVTATTLGYGDITPVGWTRLLAVAEAMSGMIIVGAIISKLLSSHQERLLQETHDLTFTERLGRIQTSLHLLVTEFQSVLVSYKSGEIPADNIELRFSSAKMLLLRDLRVVRDLVHERHHKADEGTLETILVTLNATLRAYLDARQGLDGEHAKQRVRLADLVDAICAECVPHDYSANLKHWMNHIHGLADRIRSNPS